MKEKKKKESKQRKNKLYIYYIYFKNRCDQEKERIKEDSNIFV